jgi:S-adenosylmethionine synthetase
MGIYVNTFGTAKVKMNDGEIARIIEKLFPMRPYEIEKRLKLRSPMYSETAAYGHMGRKYEIVEKTFTSPGRKITRKVELFTWEKLDYVEKVRKAFGLDRAKATGTKTVAVSSNGSQHSKKYAEVPF